MSLSNAQIEKHAALARFILTTEEEAKGGDHKKCRTQEVFLC